MQTLLTIAVERGENFPKLDVLDDTDAFVSFTVRGSSKKYRTSTKNNAGANPIWRESFQVHLASGQDVLDFSAFDEDTLTRNDIIGSFEVDLKNLQQGVSKEDWYTLTGGPKGRDNTKPVRVKLILSISSKGNILVQTSFHLFIGC